MEDKIATIDEILAAETTKYEVVDAFGLKIRLGSLSAGDMLDFIESNEGAAKKTAGLRLIALSLVDEQGNRVGKAAHLDSLKKKNAEDVNKLVGKIFALNGMTDAAKKLVGNASSEATSVASPSDSQPS